jgi:sorbitol-specific phosphotransferase system component IIC
MSSGRYQRWVLVGVFGLSAVVYALGWFVYATSFSKWYAVVVMLLLAGIGLWLFRQRGKLFIYLGAWFGFASICYQVQRVYLGPPTPDIWIRLGFGLVIFAVAVYFLVQRPHRGNPGGAR